MASAKRLPAMDIHHVVDSRAVQYYLSKDRYPTDESNDDFELFICPYDPQHRIISKSWRSHLIKCSKNYGGNFKMCPYNASHRIPEPEWEWHCMSCNDRNIIAKHYETRDWKMATVVDHKPQWCEPESEEDWGEEADEAAPTFQLNYDKAMPIQLLQPQVEPVINNVEEEQYIEEEEDVGTVYENDVLTEKLIPKIPENWNDMSKTQKKNHKRKYERQQQRMLEQGVKEEDFNKPADISKISQTQINNKLSAIKAAFPLNNNKEYAERVDFTSLLNIVCQKIKLNLPEYELTNAPQGGFMYKCRVHLDWYYGRDFCGNKKDAKHNAAKWALLGMKIPGIDFEAPAPRPKPIPPSLQANRALREGDELGRLMAAGVYPTQQTPVLRQPKVAASSNIGKGGLQSYVQNNDNIQKEGVSNNQDKENKSPATNTTHTSNDVSSKPANQSAWGKPVTTPTAQGAWKSVNSSSTANNSTNHTSLSNGIQNLNIQEEFPSLGSIKPKVISANQSKGRGRGRGTKLKL